MEMTAFVFMAGMVIFLGLLLAWVMKEAKKERADLITRIMAKSLPEYTQGIIKLTEENKNMTIEDAISQMEKVRQDDRVSIV